MSDNGGNKIKDLFDQLIAEGNRRTGSVTIHGDMQHYITIKANEAMGVGFIADGRFQSMMAFKVKGGLPMGKYRIGLFIFPEEAKKTLIVGEA